MGKSTALKVIIIKDYYKRFPNVLFYYIEAKDVIIQACGVGRQDDMLCRLAKDDRMSLIYRLWDLRTLYLFFESRDWELLELEDYLIVSKTTIDDHDAFSNRIQKLLAEEKSRLMVTMKKFG